MELAQDLFAALRDLTRSLADLLPLLGVVAASALVLGLAHRLLIARQAPNLRDGFGPHIAMLLLTGLAILAVVLALPVGDTTRGQLLSLIGLVLTAVIALSSTTFVANAMAGLMLRAVRNFRPGDFVRVGEQFGRVTELGLFHTEIQTGDRDLTTLPNLFLVTQPVTVVRASGTIVSTVLSLGYDVPHTRVEPLLIGAARQAGLEEPFVQVLELGNFSVGYRVAGFLAEVKHLLSARSRLCESVLDSLHGAGIEIVSPSFMNQRQLADDAAVVPSEDPRATRRRTARPAPAPEERVFDKAERAAEVEALRAEHVRLQGQIDELEKRRSATQTADREPIDRQLEAMRAKRAALAAQIEAAAEASSEA